MKANKPDGVNRMLDRLDYEEPRCLLCMEGDEHEKTDPRRLAQKLDTFYARDDMEGAERFLNVWLEESVQTCDRRLEFFIRNELIGVYRKTGSKGASLDNADRAMALAEELGIDGRADGAYAFINAATAYKAFGYPDVAVMLFERVSPVCERDLAETYALGSFYNNMALALSDTGEYVKAAENYEKALAVMGTSPGSEPKQAITRLNLADLYSACGKADEAGAQLEKARALLDKEGVEQNANYAFVCSKCAPVFEHYGMTEYAKTLEERSRRIYERA